MLIEAEERKVIAHNLIMKMGKLINNRMDRSYINTSIADKWITNNVYALLSPGADKWPACETAENVKKIQKYGLTNRYGTKIDPKKVQ